MQGLMVVCLCDDRMIGDTFRWTPKFWRQRNLEILNGDSAQQRTGLARDSPGNPRPKEILTPARILHDRKARAKHAEQQISHFPLNFHSRSRDHHCVHVFPKVHLRTEEVRLIAVKDRACLTFFGNHCAEFNRSTIFIHPRQHAPLSSWCRIFLSRRF